MRLLRSSAVGRLLACCLLSLGLGRAVGAQQGPSNEGGLDFLFPIGARTIAMGQAAAASAVGSDAVWWNPALIARGPREFALQVSHNSSPVLSSDVGGAVVIPVNRLGAFALSFRLLSNGSQTAQNTSGDVVGSFTPGSAIIGATFAPILTDRLDGGITYKLLRLTFASTGAVDQPENVPQTAALDLGFRYRLTSDSSIMFGAAVRNIGLKLQVKDTPQSDPLPARADFGVAYMPKLAQLPKEAKLRLAADMLTCVVGGTSAGFRIGGEFSWMDRYEARAGYVATGPTGSGPTFGFGISTGKLHIDLAQMLSDLAPTGSTPTYLSLRYIF